MPEATSSFGRALLSAGLAAASLLSACQPVSPLLVREAPPAFFSDEADAYAEARWRSLELRKNIDELAKATSREPPSDALQRLGLYRREYFSLREILFSGAMLHASAIVERAEGQDLGTLLLRSSLALVAGTTLLQNSHAVAALLRDHPALRAAWNEPDPEYGIPKDSWELSLQTYSTSHHQDLFRAAIERLKGRRGDLERHLKANDRIFFALYPDGIESALQEAEETYTLLRAGFASEDLAQDEAEVRLLVERSKKLRNEWAASAPLLRQAIMRDGGLIRGNVHVRVHAAKRDYLDLREALYRLAFKHVAKLTREDIPYPRPFRLRAVGISLLAAVTLYENARRLQTSLLSIPGVKALLNQGDPALGIPRGFWDNIETEFTRLQYRRLLETGIQAVDEARHLPSGPAETQPFFAYLAAEIATSTAIPEIRGEGILPKLVRALQSYSGLVQKMSSGILGIAASPLFTGVGSLAGIELRKGKLFDQPQWAEFVKERLRPGDLLLEKSPFRLSNKFIPGHFGHVALYVGTAAELKALDLLQQPWVAKYVKQVGERKTIVEALPGGTRLSTIEDFLNTDDLAIIRPKSDKIPPADVARAITLAFSHIGKQYDFSFDNNTWDAIVCSELAFHTYVNVRWPFAKILSSYTISPDDVAVVAGSDPARPFELITFVHDGQVVHDRATGLLDEPKYIDLLGKRYDEAGYFAAR
ncbi:MAG: hypothetical protein HYT87_20150 [Nitrospirae bacterium]|nr:hypothetical protein [Nitrospirota bacterium]